MVETLVPRAGMIGFILSFTLLSIIFPSCSKSTHIPFSAPWALVFCGFVYMVIHMSGISKSEPYPVSLCCTAWNRNYRMLRCKYKDAISYTTLITAVGGNLPGKSLATGNWDLHCVFV